MESITISKLADIVGVSHLTCRKRLKNGGAKPGIDGSYAIEDVLRAYEQLASGKADAAEAKTKLAELRVERASIELRREKSDLVERTPYNQFMSTALKVLWRFLWKYVPIEGQDEVDTEWRRLLSEFHRQNPNHIIASLTLTEREDAVAIGILKSEESV